MSYLAPAPFRHGTDAATQAAEALGIYPTERDFRGVVAAIMATVVGEASDAVWVSSGHRDAELWDCPLGGRRVLILYLPAEARIVGVSELRHSQVWREPSGCDGKVRHASYRAAARAGGRPRPSVRYGDPYHCRECGAWHLGGSHGE